MSAAKKLSDLGKKWSSAPGWAGDTRRAVSPLRLPHHAMEKPEAAGEEFRRQYEIWRSEHPQSAPPDLPAMEAPGFDMKRAVRIGLIASGAALAAFYLAGVLPNLNSGGFQPAPVPEPPVAKPIKTARLDVPPMPVAAKPSDVPAWPDATMQSAAKQVDRVGVKTTQVTASAEIASPGSEAQVARNDTPSRPARTLSAEEIGLMLKRGEEFITTGDLASARLVLERAARAHDARAAFALASTYDPAVLEKMKVVGATGDLELAIMWYERAKLYGSRDAGPRLLALAGRD